jgi:hypothetical protein
MSQWLSGDRKPTSAKSINALVSRYGGEVYDVLGISPAFEVDTEINHSVAELAKLINSLSPEDQKELTSIIRSMVKKRTKDGE